MASCCIHWRLLAIAGKPSAALIPTGIVVIRDREVNPVILKNGTDAQAVRSCDQSGAVPRSDW